jgi:amino acid transporter
MDVMPILWIVWAVVAGVLLILLGYRGTLTRYEEDQIFLDEALTAGAQQQHDIQRKLERIRPFLVVTLWMIGILTAIILGMYIRDAVKDLL